MFDTSGAAVSGTIATMLRGHLRAFVLSAVLSFVAFGCADAPPPPATTAAAASASTPASTPPAPAAGSPSAAALPPQTGFEQPNADDATRVIALDGAVNVRDLGGLKGAHGPVPPNHFIRTADLSKASDKDRQTLKDHGVSLDVDLRTQEEISKKPDTLATDKRFKYVNVSLLGQAPLDFTKVTTLGDLYVQTLSDHQAEFKKVFQAMAAQKDGAVLYHCSAGKDRTGMVTAILLDLAGVDRKEIVHNYAISGAYLPPVTPEMMKERPELARIMGTPPDQMEKFLDVLESSQYGGPAAYLKKIGLSDAEIKTLSTKLGQ